MKKIILLLMFGIVLFNFASALDDQGTGTRGQNFTLIQVCEDATYMTLSTLQYPDRSVRVINTNMTSTGGGSFQYNLSDLVIGRYDAGGISDGCERTFGIYFDVTPEGFTLETAESNLYIIVLIITLLLFSGFLYLSITLRYTNKTNPDGSITRISKQKYLKLLSMWFAYGFLMWFLQTLNAISKSFLSLTYLSNFITNIFTYSQWFSVGVTFLILTIIFIEVWKDIILSKTIRKYGKAYLDGRFK